MASHEMMTEERYGKIKIITFLPTNKTDLHDITEILLKVALSTINRNHKIVNGDKKPEPQAPCKLK
jgi:hypothetical protein